MDDPSHRDPLELLADEFTERLRRGQHPSVTEYAAQHPELAEEIRELFPTIAEMEKLKTRREAGSSGRVTLAADVPQKLGDYRILREIGRGGMGIVYEAEQVSLRRPVAVKILPRLSLADPRHLQRFQREAQTPARLHHTNIVPVFGVGQDEGYHYIVMQRIEGVGLDEILASVRQGRSAGRDGSRSGSPSSRSANEPASAGAAPADPITASGQQPARASEETPPGKRSVFAELARQMMVQNRSRCDRPASRHGIDETSPLGVSTEGARALPPAQPQPAAPLAPRLNATYWCGVAEIGTQAAEALQYAHSQGVLHRDIKPANLLVDGQGVVWISDFGLAKAQEGDDKVSRTGDLVGTLRYMAPEQFRGQSDARSDLFSLGLTLYEAATLTPVFDDSDRSSLMRRILECHPAPPRKINPAIPRDLETILLKTIAREPKDRYVSAGELAADLHRFLEDQPIHARRVTLAEQAWRWGRRNPLVAGLASAVLLLLMLVAMLASAGYVHARNAEGQVRKALAGETREREKAEATSAVARDQRRKSEANLELALEVLDQIFAKLSPGGNASGSTLTVDDSDGKQIEVPVQPELSPQNAALLENLLVFYDRLAEQDGGSVQVQEGTAQAICRVAAIQSLLGQVEKAAAAYERALNIYDHLARLPGTKSDYAVETAHVHNELGSLYRTSAQPSKALAAYRRSLELLKPKEGGASQSVKERFEQARTYYCLATVGGPGFIGGPPGPRMGPGRRFRRPSSPGPESPRQDRDSPKPPDEFGPAPQPHGRPEEAEWDSPTQAAAGAARPKDRSPPPPRPEASSGPPPPPEDPSRPPPSADLSRPPGSPEERDRLDPGDQANYLAMARRILEDLSRQEPDEPSYRHLLALCYRDAPQFRESTAETFTRLGKATEILAALVDKYPAVPEYRHDLVEAYASFDLRGPFSASDVSELVRKRLATALELSESLVAEYPNVPTYLVSQVHIYLRLAEVLRRSDHADESETNFRKAVELQASLVRRFPEQTSHQWALAALYHGLARSLLHGQKLDEAKGLFEKSASLLEPLTDDNHGWLYLNGLQAENYNCLAQVLERQGQAQAAADARQRANRLRPGRPWGGDHGPGSNGPGPGGK